MDEAIITEIKAGYDLSLKIACAPFNPSEVIGSSWFFWRGPKDGNGSEGEEERDKVSLALTEVDFAKIDFFNCLKENETSINGKEKLSVSGNLAAKSTAQPSLWASCETTDRARIKPTLCLISCIIRRASFVLIFSVISFSLLTAAVTCCVSVAVAMVRGT